MNDSYKHFHPLRSLLIFPHRAVSTMVPTVTVGRSKSEGTGASARVEVVVEREHGWHLGIAARGAEESVMVRVLQSRLVLGVGCM